MKELKEFLSSKGAKLAICLIGLVIVIGLAFCAGFVASRKKAGFGIRQGKNYNQTFRGGMMNGSRSGSSNVFNGMMGKSVAQRNTSISGKITNLTGNSITIQGQNGVESTFTITAQTSIQNSSGAITVSGLKVGDNVSIVNLPNNTGTAEARSISVAPATNGQ
ncbi:MAG: DUF5666 domain-containing protein [Patescibacteria group bacterium]|nr:DUF5666 domain-containing protein [Patescibacteria group bacterium]